MPNPLPPTGFWSYSRADDEDSDGRLSQLRTLLVKELRQLLGRRGRVRLFQDVAIIDYGDRWEERIKAELAECSFLIPILTPDFFQSEWCCKEVLFFQEREAALGRNDLTFPILWVKPGPTDPSDPDQVFDAAVWERMRTTHQVDLTAWRHHMPDQTIEVLQKLAGLAESIVGGLRRNGTMNSAAPPEALSANVMAGEGPPPTTSPVGVPSAATSSTPKPAWASAAGTDAYGTWADLTVGSAVQRLRLIHPGRFTMGSPDDEPRRFGDEGPARPVEIREPFWLFDTPCTQALWQAAMGKNPSFFQGPARPVEQVSFDDTIGFLKKLNDRAPGLNLALPSEAQWEYACRAGSKSARYTLTPP